MVDICGNRNEQERGAARRIPFPPRTITAHTRKDGSPALIAMAHNRYKPMRNRTVPNMSASPARRVDARVIRCVGVDSIPKLKALACVCGPPLSST